MSHRSRLVPLLNAKRVPDLQAGKFFAEATLSLSAMPTYEQNQHSSPADNWSDFDCDR